MKTLILRMLLLAALGLTLTACNTIHGIGRDVEAAGEWMQEEAETW